MERKFDDWINELRNRDLRKQAEVTEIAKRNYANYSKTNRSVADQWMQDLRARPDLAEVPGR